MISKTQLATNPRHRPRREALAVGWRESTPGRWSRETLGVVLESDGLWHSYVTSSESVFTSPGFYTVTEAIQDVERRAEDARRSA